jgi:twitching motility protein PilT
MLKEILSRAVERGASDILIIAGLPVSYKINGRAVRQDDVRLRPDATRALVEEVYALAGNRGTEKLLATGDDDFSFSVSGLSRFRVNALRQRGSLGLVIRVVSFTLPDRQTSPRASCSSRALPEAARPRRSPASSIR